MSPTDLRRHQLAYLTDAGWGALLARHRDACDLACLDHWRTCGLPLVVTRQGCASDGRSVALGLPAPIQYERRRLALQVPGHAIARFAEPPTLRHVLGRVGESRIQGLHGLADALDALGVQTRVFGSYAWQALTGLRYLHPHSDLDLLVDAPTAAKADAVVARLLAPIANAPRLDGELRFPGEGAVAWREWANWRARQVGSVMVKRAGGAALAERLDQMIGAAVDPVVARAAQ